MKDRQTFLAIMLADIFVMGGAFFVMVDRYRLHTTITPPALSAGIPAKTFSPIQPEPAKKVPAATPFPDTAEQPAAPSIAQKVLDSKPGIPRRILFTYRNSKPKGVEIVGSFNNWKPLRMKKGANYIWSTMIPLEPGDYTYNYLVDGKVVRDPNNPRTAPEGRSLITVKDTTAR
ncbi:MAG: glycogen-binding domain-containing protein [Elusimicrobia bacterium]|nr:glycogen-binding domain-containing protein [Candidatus Obscuribacterium magneticum]